VSIYREYDIRGIYEKELNEESVTKIGYVLASKIEGEYVAVGYDARSHSPILFEYLIAGLNAGGKKVLGMGLVPTPVNYFTNYQDWDGVTPSASVMITGSHNPSEYNGFKITVEKAPFFSEDIYALGRECEAIAMPKKVQRDVTEIDAVSRYVDFLVNEFEHLKGMDTRIVYDCGNGVAGVVTELTSIVSNTRNGAVITKLVKGERVEIFVKPEEFSKYAIFDNYEDANNHLTSGTNLDILKIQYDYKKLDHEAAKLELESQIKVIENLFLIAKLHLEREFSIEKHNMAMDKGRMELESTIKTLELKYATIKNQSNASDTKSYGMILGGVSSLIGDVVKVIGRIGNIL